MGIRRAHLGTCARHTIARIILRGRVHVSRVTIWQLVVQESRRLGRRRWRLDRDVLLRSGTTAENDECSDTGQDDSHNA